jgi:CHAD domain-containing protein
MIPSTPWLDALEARIAAVQDGAGEEDVHQLRVATRRLSSWLKLGRMRVLRSDLRWLRAAGGGVRDLDVLLAGGPPDGMGPWLASERERRAAHLLEVIRSPRAEALCAALAHIPPIDRDRARQGIPRLAAPALEQGDRLQLAPGDVEAFHRMRRSVRGLRYALEWLDQETRPLKEFQDLSGRAADLSLALLVIDQYPDAAGLADQRRELEETFAARRLEVVAAWPGLRREIEALA